MGNKMINCLCLYMRKAIPFGLQHVLAMFVANLAPVLIVCSAALVRGSGEHLTAAEITQILQCAMFAAGIGTCMQLYPVWKIGSKLPIVMGVSFTFLGSLLIICTNPKLGYEGMIGAVILGGCTVMMFGSIMYGGIKMLKNCEFNDRTMIIVSLSFCIGVGLTQTSGNFFSAFPKEVGDIFNGNAVAGVFVVSLLLSLLLPKKKQAN